uniref:Reverse transcriptase domain-containing protein n=1 Tax=Apteryx owenii TaxID=8824 RepID=A0A8B9SC50_APTOW
MGSRIKCLSEVIEILTGVKQGDPVSLMMFNLSIAPLLRRLEKIRNGFKHGRKSVTLLVFADDLVLLSVSCDGMQGNIMVVEGFCQLTGLRLQAEKCHRFLIRPTEDSDTISDCDLWKVNGSKLNRMDLGSSKRYLGLGLDPRIGLAKPELQEKLDTWVKNIGDAPLKVLQRAEILKRYAIPRLLYAADHPGTNASYFQSLKWAKRMAVKSWPHLPSSMSDFIP